ncbi:MAG TPA: alcohol dehydrogenase catalytic domain-containing protein [Anaerolineaceae bacterium]|nr:alcohol dehydrogenase catalytic domain-containing protein [Anaerolineaceae bacterium]HQH35451.1 alcohol dehydrogenase catalytic domain-containing protein [Anaerolineaceae bacterium]HQJ03178.1 alcohol dehydrogenase catalytic domain-containing protein [Anaerolineaceae bacterium]
MDTMKALVMKDVGRVEMEQLPIPHVKDPDDVLLRINAVGICGSDIKIIEGKHHYRPNTVLGHEFCGEVVEVGSHVHHVKLGDRVAVDNNIRCGFCDFCRMGLTSQCVDIKTSALGVMRNGGYAEYCLVPEKQCFVLPDEIDDILGTQVETLATVVNGMNTLQMLPYDYVMVIGFGPIGYLFAQFAKNIAAKVAVTEIDPYRIEIARQCGLTVWNPNEVDVVQKITEFTYGRKADIVIEATGNGFEQALKCVTPGGKVLPFGMDSSITATVIPNEITRWATKILGLYLGQNTMVPSIRIFQENRLNMEPFFTKVIPLDDGISAFEDLGLDMKTLERHPKKAMKIVMKP